MGREQARAQLGDRFGAQEVENKCVCAVRACLSQLQASTLLKANKFAFKSAGIRSVVPCQCSLDTSIVLRQAFCKDICTGQVAFRGYAKLVRVRHLRQILPLPLACVRRHLADRTPVRRKILKPTPKIFGVTLTKCTLDLIHLLRALLRINPLQKCYQIIALMHDVIR